MSAAMDTLQRERPASGASLELGGIHAGYGDFAALFGVSLRVDPGEAVGVVGPNGAGKTTLLRVISGLIRPTAGSLRFDGHDLAATPAHALPALGIAHVPENRRLFPHLTVEENLKVGAFSLAARPHFVGAAGPCLRPVPEDEGAAAPVGRHHVGRRAADVRDRPGADVRAAHPAARRALGRAGAAGGAAGLRPGPPHPAGGADGADRRAERGAGAARGRPRLCAGDRAGRRRGALGGAGRRPCHPSQLSRGH